MRWLLVGLVGLGLGCTDARDELAALGIAYTEEAFFSAALNGDLTVVKLFVEAGMSVNTADNDGFTALHGAALEGRLSVVRYLVEQGADVNARSYGFTTDLIWALLQVGQGADVNAKGNSGFTALDVAAMQNHREVMGYLESVGAN